MNEVVKFLNENPVVYLATVDKDHNPRVRPFQFMLEQGDRLYFCTSNQKEVYAEIQQHPYIEFSIASKEFAWIRLFGKVVFSEAMEIKGKIIENNELVRSIYQTPDNPAFEVFYLDEATATIAIADFSGNPPKSFKM